MKNRLDIDYLQIMQDILEYGNLKESRIGQTKSLFGLQIKHQMNSGFPLITTKKVYFKGIVTELLWFLAGDTNLKYLVDHDCNIWVGDAYKKYVNCTSENNSEWNEWMRDNGDDTLSMYTRDQFIEQIKTNEAFADKWGSLGPVYGKQWRDWLDIDYYFNGTRPMIINNSIDQLKLVIDALKTNPDDRRMIVNAWNPARLEQMIVPPCHYSFQVYTRNLTDKERVNLMNKKLGVEEENLLLPYLRSDLQKLNIPEKAISLIWNQRSCDTPLGIPFNIASYGLLLQILAKHVNMIPDTLIGNLGDTHIYLNQIDEIQEQFTNKPYELPTVELSNEINWTQDFDELLKILMPEPLKYIKLLNYKSHNKIKITLSN